MALSTMKYEYLEACHASKEVVWLQSSCLEIGFK